ncbi:MAG: glycine zipper 2TM domain-containing protein [Candidatus Aquirickettsiella gammari]|uniref:Glycine zipper 2TM domain-containing protein n=1 Tax=Candidatus Aquirickettsiella gammari TaxID=2016198 RepID=A0A370CJA0_9COXI|nr:MAG: glycine zipper 2TM domain-containing protein [Candidatus Aquirickettsiella gammari]
MKFYVHFLMSLLSLLTLAGCAPSLSPDRYTTGNAGQIQGVVQGVVVSSRVVQVSNSGSGLGVGSITGGALGAIAGSQVGQGNGSLAAGIGGALLGGIVGNQVQKGLSTQTGVEYVLRLRNKSLISVVQGPTPSFNRGQHVLVQYGASGRARIIADPNYYAR